MSNEPVTVVVTRKVREGKTQEYEAWLERLIQQASLLPGYLGMTLHRPDPKATSLEYTSVFRFDSIEHLRAFERSDLRRTAMAEVIPLVEGDATWKELTGLELWFTPPPELVIPQPTRWKMVLILIVVVYLMVLSIGQLVALVFGSLPMQLRLLITIALEVTLLTYVLMPRITRAFARWIYPSSHKV